MINPEGKIVRARAWSNAGKLRSDLKELVGKVEKITLVSDLDMKQQELGFDSEIARGVIKPIQITERMANVKSVPMPSDDSYFVKLHAQASDELLENGTGKLYFAFHLDPIFEVHWNNLVAPIQYELEAGDGAKVSAASGSGPKIDEAADLDPREFLVDIENPTPETEITLTVTYFACTDEWCRSLVQKYAINLESDPSNQLSRPRSNRR